MNEIINEQILKERNEKIKKDYNKLLIGVFVLFIFSYFFFFTSKLWMPVTYGDIEMSKIGTEKQLNDRKFTLLSWTYSEKENAMEIVLDMKNGSVDGYDDYVFSAKERTKGPCDCKIVFSSSDYFVVKIENIPRRFAEISLRINVEGVSEEDFQTVKFYTTKKEVKRVEQIEELTKPEYLKQGCNYRIAIANKEIDTYLEKIEYEKNILCNAEKQMKEMKTKEKFQTTEEKMENLELLSKLDGEYRTSKSKIQDYEKKILELHEKIKMQEEKKEVY